MNDSLTLTAAGNDICQTSTMVAYSLLECLTVETTYTAQELAVTDTSSNISYPCQNTDVTKCQYTTITMNEPTYSAIFLEPTLQKELTFSGANLNQLNAGCEVEVLGIIADMCVISDANTIVATFDDGFPVSQEAVTPTLRLLGPCDNDMTDICTAASVTNKLIVARS